jgi:HAD superfamily hydrolase (TIGR01450 family)
LTLNASPTFKGILADLDGTVNRGKVLIQGAKETYERLSAQGVKWLFLSNNASVLAEDLAERIRKMGVPVQDREVLNSASVLISILETEFPGARVMVVGERRLIEGIKGAGAVITEDPKGVDVLVSAMDRGFTYDKLARAQAAVLNGALFFATNTDVSFPAEHGLLPGAGAIVAAISAACGKGPDRVFGKPSRHMASEALRRIRAPAGDCLLVGDRMSTDILFGLENGMSTALVLTGVTSAADLESFPYRPDFVFESILEIQRLFPPPQ